MVHNEIFIKKDGDDYIVSLSKNNGYEAYFITELALMEFKDKLDQPIKESELPQPLIKAQ